MPTNAFLNLEKNKQNKLIEAAILEFSNNLFVDASINSIIKTINMPRGSFYLYFENKEDLYLYILETYNTRLIERFREFSIKNNGDLISIFIDLFDFIANKTIEANLKPLIRNIFINMNSKQLNLVFDKESKNQDIKKLISFIDKNKLNANDDQEIKSILRIMMIMMAQALGSFFTHDIPYEKVKNTFIRDISILKKGLYK